MLESTESDFEATEMPAIILEGEMLVFINAEEDDDTEVVTTTPGPDPLQVIQVVNKLDDLPTDNIPLITTPSPEELLRQQQLELNEVADNLGAEDIVDVISNFIADVDPTLQLFLSICFVHPSCYQDSPPSAASSRASEARSSLQELFYVLDLNMEADKVRALAEVADIITAIPARVETLYERATQEGYKDYVRHSSWDSWKRNPSKETLYE